MTDRVHPVDISDELLLLLVLDQLSVVFIIGFALRVFNFGEFVSVFLPLGIKSVDLLVIVFSHLGLGVERITGLFDLPHQLANLRTDSKLDGSEFLANLLFLLALLADLFINGFPLLDKRLRVLDELNAPDQFSLTPLRVGLLLQLSPDAPYAFFNLI